MNRIHRAPRIPPAVVESHLSPTSSDLYRDLQVEEILRNCRHAKDNSTNEVRSGRKEGTELASATVILYESTYTLGELYSHSHDRPA
jgi:hypothetical protein